MTLRLMSWKAYVQNESEDSLSMSEYKETMKDVYTTL